MPPAWSLRHANGNAGTLIRAITYNKYGYSPAENSGGAIPAVARRTVEGSDLKARKSRMPLRHACEYYHKRAEELRTAASTVRSSDDCCTLICFADDYDELAEEAAFTEEKAPPPPR